MTRRPDNQSIGRHIWTLLGIVSVALGVIGILVPLLPTTPFLILGAYFFSHGSRRMHAWLLNHPILGPPIRDWSMYRAISRRAKSLAVITIALLFVLSVVLEVPRWALVIEAIILSSVSLYLVTRPTPPRDS